MLNEKQLVWRCRRGVRELDVVLSQFLDAGYPLLNDVQRSDFERLLEIQDPIIMDWLFGKAAIDDDGLEFIIGELKKASGL